MGIGAVNYLEKIKEVNTDRSARQRREAQQYKDIFEAIQNGDLASVKYFVEQKNVDVNSRAPGNSGTALGSAAGAGHYNIVEYLVTKGADVNAKDKFGYNSLLWALDKNTAKLGLIKYLVSNGAEVNVADSNSRYSPLHWAAAHNHLDVVQYLLENNADINAKTKDGNTPYTLAKANGHNELTAYLTTDKRFRVTGDIFDAAASGNVGLVLHMVENEHVQPLAKNQNGETALHIAAAKGKIEVVKYFLNSNNGSVNIKNENGETPLILACAKGHISVVRYLLEVKYANPESVDKKGNTPLLAAAKNGRVEVMRYLIEQANADVNAKDGESSNVLHIAAQNNQMLVVKYLVDDRRFNIYSKNKKGETALHIAASKAYLDIVKYFIDEKGMEIVIISNDGRNVLHKACESNNLQMVKYLIEEKNADITTKDGNQNTPLHIAVENDRLDLVRYLAEQQGIDLYAKNNAGLDVIALAKSLSRKTIYRYLQVDKGMTVATIRPYRPTTRGTHPTPTMHHDLVPEEPQPKYRNPSQTYLFNGQVVDGATRDKFIDEFLKSGSGLNTREESFTNNGQQIVKYYINGMQVDLATRNKIISDYKNGMNNQFQFTKYYVNGKEVNLEARNKYLNDLARPGQNQFPNSGNRRSVAAPNFDSSANILAASNQGVIYHLNGQIVDEKTYRNALRQNYYVQPGDMHEYYEESERRKRSISHSVTTATNLVSNSSRLVQLGGRNAGLLPSARGQGDSNAHSEVAPSINNFLTLIDIGARHMTGYRYSALKHESLMSPKEIVENKIDSNAIKSIYEFDNVYDKEGD